MRLGQQMRRVWWGNALRGKVPANVQIRWIFSLLDRLMACACIARCFLLSSDVIIQFPVVRFKLASNPRNVFFHRRKFRFCCIQFLRGQPSRVRAAETRPDQFCPLFRKPRSSPADICRSRFQIGWNRVKRMQIGELFQEITVGSLAFLNASFHGGQLALADVDVAFRLVALLEKWLLFRLQLCNRLSLFARILFLLQFLKSDYLIAQLWKTSRLGSALAPEIDFALL